jgi:methionyl-tRNA synthetase
MNLARLGNKYLADSEPWKINKSDPEKVKTIINIALQITANLTIVLEPFLPFTMKKLRALLNCESFTWADAGRNDLVPAGHKINKPDLLFEKIEDSVIDKQIAKLQASKKANEASASKTVAVKDPVDFDLFSKVDIRTATILEA